MRSIICGYRIAEGTVGTVTLKEEEIADLVDVGLGEDFIFFFVGMTE